MTLTRRLHTEFDINVSPLRSLVPEASAPPEEQAALDLLVGLAFSLAGGSDISIYALDPARCAQLAVLLGKAVPADLRSAVISELSGGIILPNGRVHG